MAWLLTNQYDASRLSGSVYCANLNGSNKKTLLVAEGHLSGIAYAELPAGH
jgi:hypothetical protein